MIARSHISLKDSLISPTMAYDQPASAATEALEQLDSSKVIKGLTKFMYVGRCKIVKKINLLFGKGDGK